MQSLIRKLYRDYLNSKLISDVLSFEFEDSRELPFPFNIQDNHFVKIKILSDDEIVFRATSFDNGLSVDVFSFDDNWLKDLSSSMSISFDWLLKLRNEYYMNILNQEYCNSQDTNPNRASFIKSMFLDSIEKESNLDIQRLTDYLTRSPEDTLTPEMSIKKYSMDDKLYVELIYQNEIVFSIAIDSYNNIGVNIWKNGYWMRVLEDKIISKLTISNILEDFATRFL